MGPKSLFIVGIVVAHGALAAGLARQEGQKPRASIATCFNEPVDTPHFEPPREMLAMTAIPIVDLRLQQP
jgi:hypothetical protein